MTFASCFFSPSFWLSSFFVVVVVVDDGDVVVVRSFSPVRKG
jgi:hypothetical protein